MKTPDPLGNDTFYSTATVAEMFEVDPSTVRTWRQRRYGPRGWFKTGGKHVIRARHVHDWAAQREAEALAAEAAALAEFDRTA